MAKLSHEDVDNYIEEHPEAKSLFDYARTKSVATFRENHPPDEDLGKRLAKIDQRLTEKETLLKANELRFYAFKKCADTGINFDLLDGYPLQSEKDVGAKIDQLAASITTASQKNLAAIMAQEAHRPTGGGVDNDDKPKTLSQYMAEATARLSKND